MSSLTTSVPLHTGYHPPPQQPTAHAQRPRTSAHLQSDHHVPPPHQSFSYQGQPGQAQPYVFKAEPTTPPLQPYYAVQHSGYSALPHYQSPQIQRPHTSHTYPSHHRYMMSSPDRTPAPGEVSHPPSQGYQQPMTPISGSDAHYSGPAPPGVSQFYGVATSHQHMPSPPPTSQGRPTSANFTPDGLPIVPVGISGGKMFRCKGFGECDKVFTRSEHLARHVRKHTGERPFPCHCGKAFSRLDNLRQHAATVHADQSTRNDQMLNELSAVHAALSQKANKEQRKRGEIVEVPKNAVERPRTTDVSQRSKRSGSLGPHGMGQPPYPYPPPGTGESTSSATGHGGWGMPAQGRPRTSSGWDYPPYQAGPSGSGPSSGPMSDHPDDRRPGSSASAMGGFQGYQPYYPPNPDNRGPQPAQSSSNEPMSQLPYPFRPISSNGRELPVPAHYSAEDGNPQGPPGSGWQSPQPAFGPAGPSNHEGGHMYPPQEHGGNGGPYQAEQYPANHSHGYYYPPPPQQQQQSYYPPAQQQHYPPVYQGVQGPPAQEPPFSYGAHGQHQYPPYGYDPASVTGRKRRADDVAQEEAHRAKQSRSHEDLRSGGLHPASAEGPRDPNWLPPTNERRSSLAISALLGSPQEAPKSRPGTGQVMMDPAQHGAQPYLQGYSFGRVEGENQNPVPSASVMSLSNGGARSRADTAEGYVVLPKPTHADGDEKSINGHPHGLVNDMDAKAKALLELGQPEGVVNQG